MSFYAYSTWTIAFSSLIFVLFSRSYSNSIVLLVGVSLWNIPVVMFGNTSSSGLFAADIVSLAIFIRFLIFGQQRIWICQRAVMLRAFSLIVLYAFVRAVTVVYGTSYGYYNNFIWYGAFRWTTYLILFIIFIQPFSGAEYIRILKKISYIFMFYTPLLLAHQLGIVDASGLEVTGHRYIYEIEYLSPARYSTFLGNNAATVGFVSFSAICVALLLLRNGGKKWLLTALLLLSLLVLLGSFSRTDVIATTICIVTCLIFFARSGISSEIRKQLGALSISLLILGTVIGLLLDQPFLQWDSVERLSETDYWGEFLGTSSGTLAYRIHNRDLAAEFLSKNPSIALFGFGPNGYRMFTQYNAGVMTFGHNVYFHTIGELGVFGLLLVGVWLWRIVQQLMRQIKSSTPLVVDLSIIATLLIINRIIAGYAVDTIFAVDNMLTTSLFFLFLVGVAISIGGDPADAVSNNETS